MVCLFMQYELEKPSASFKDYFKTHVCREKLVDGVRLYVPLFYCGSGSSARAGHPASQNLAELAVKLVKDVVQRKPVSEQDLLLQLADRWRVVNQLSIA